MWRIIFLFLLSTTSIHAQVGIGTSEPHPDAMLDINGALRVRSYSNGKDTAAKDSIAVFDGRGVVQRISTKKLLANMDKSLVRASLTNSTGALVDISVSGEKRIKFNNEDFDIKEEYDPSTGIFTASDSGIYRVTAQIKTSSLLSAADLGLAIYKTKFGETTGLKIAEESFENITVALVKVTPPVRSVSTLIKLENADKLSFRVLSTLTVGIASSTNGYDSFCTIEQVR